MADKYIGLDANGNKTEIAGQDTSAGASDAGKLVALNDVGVLDETMLPIPPEVKVIVASEALTAGDFVNVYNNAGTANVRKADASTTDKEANGFVLADVNIGENVKVYSEGRNSQVTGASIGRVFLSDSTPGSFTSTAPTAGGSILQPIGYAISATEIVFEIGEPIVRA